MEFEDLVKEEHLKLRDDFMDWETEDGKTFKGLGVFPQVPADPRPGVAPDAQAGRRHR